jgi:hypothetical protein
MLPLCHYAAHELDKTRTTVYVDKSDYNWLRVELMKIGVSFSAWLRTEMKQAREKLDGSQE